MRILKISWTSATSMGSVWQLTPCSITLDGNSTSTLQRDVVFHMDREEIKKIATDGVAMVKNYMKDHDGEVVLEYSPESFTGTELDFALDICNAVQRAWGPTPEHKMIMNLPSTVEMTTPNVYADQIEWMNRHLENRWI